MWFKLWTDVRYSTRALVRSPAFAVTAIATIALGVGVNAGIFTVLNGVLFRDLPAPDGHEVVSISRTLDDVSGDGRALVSPLFSTSEFEVLRGRARSLSGIMGHSDPTRTTLGGERPEQLLGTIVTCNYFDVLRQPVALGRGLSAPDCEPGAAPVVVLAHAFWETRLGGDRDVVGRTVELNRQRFTVIGVAARGTYSGLGLYETGYFAPVSAEPLLLPNEKSFGDDQRGWLFLVGRRTASLEQVRAELGVIAAQTASIRPGGPTVVHVERATPLGGIAAFQRVALAIGSVTMAGFGLVLLVACANVASLLLVRTAARGREIAVRLSLGASRGRVIQQVLVESLLVCSVGGVLGSLLALSTFPALIASALPSITPVGIPLLVVDATPDVRVLGFALALTTLTGLFCGLSPAVHMSKPDLHTVIKEESLGLNSHGGRLQRMFVGAQVAVCMVLMVVTALLLRGLSATRAIDPGFTYDGVAVAALNLPAAGYDAEESAEFQRRLVRAIEGLPGVEAAAYAAIEPLRADAESALVRVPTTGQLRVAQVNFVSPGYFELVGISLVRGATFAGPDLAPEAMGVIVTEATARNLWPGQDPIGRTLMLSMGGDTDVSETVVGVARDAQVTSIGRIDPYYLYLPARPPVAPLLQLLVESRLAFRSTEAAIQEVARSLDPVVVVQVNRLEANLDYWRGLSSTVTGMAGTLGVLALALASLGIYGVVSYFASRHWREIGIRLALGAGRQDVLALLLGRTMRPVVAGALLGIAVAAGTSRALSAVLFGVSPADPVGFAGGALLVLGVALIAGILAGRPAMQADPNVALRRE